MGLVFSIKRFTLRGWDWCSALRVSHGRVDVDVVSPEELGVDMTYSHVAAVPRVQLLGASEAVSVLRRGERRNLLRFLLKKAAVYTIVQVKLTVQHTELFSVIYHWRYPLWTSVGDLMLERNIKTRTHTSVGYDASGDCFAFWIEPKNAFTMSNHHGKSIILNYWVTGGKSRISYFSFW